MRSPRRRLSVRIRNAISRLRDGQLAEFSEVIAILEAMIGEGA